jgi:hypothetical protein
MSTDQDTTRIVRSWMREDGHESADRVLDAVLDALDTTPQRRAGWPAWRTTMNKFVTIGLGAAAVIAVLLVGAQLLDSPSGGLGADPTSTATSDPTPPPSPTATEWSGLPAGAFVISDDKVRVTVDVAAPGWSPYREFEAMYKNDDGLDAPDTVGAGLLAWAWPAGTEFNVFGDPCQWHTTSPETPATTPDEIAAAFADQAQTEATAPVDVTVGGYAGKAVTLHVPMSYEVPGATREEEFGDCDDDAFALYGIESDEPTHERNVQGPGQIDELWILDVDGSIVILDAAYSPATPAELVEELRALAESATFEAAP